MDRLRRQMAALAATTGEAARAQGQAPAVGGPSAAPVVGAAFAPAAGAAAGAVVGAAFTPGGAAQGRAASGTTAAVTALGRASAATAVQVTGLGVAVGPAAGRGLSLVSHAAMGLHGALGRLGGGAVRQGKLFQDESKKRKEEQRLRDQQTLSGRGAVTATLGFAGAVSVAALGLGKFAEVATGGAQSGVMSTLTKSFQLVAMQ